MPGSLSGWFYLAAAASVSVAAFANGRRLQRSAHATTAKELETAKGVVLSRAGNVNGQDYWPLNVWVQTSGLGFSSLGMRIKVPYAAIKTHKKRSLFFTYVYITSSVDPTLHIRISSGLAKEIEALSEHKFRAA